MSKLKTSDLVKLIDQLGTQKVYDYATGKTKFRITEVIKPEGPIIFLRWKSNKTEKSASLARVSKNQLATVASVFSAKPNYPIHLDRLFSAGGNTRSALEALLANTPNFFICYLQRTHVYTGNRSIQKHIIWRPIEKHPLGKITETNYEQEISEVEFDINFGDIRPTPENLGKEFKSIEAKTLHTQMQVALVKIGNALNFKTWIAKPDQSIPVENRKLGNLEGVINSLDEVPILFSAESKRAAHYIDCIWFTSDFKHIPAVIEIEHNTKVNSGLARMLNFKETLPSINMNFVIVADNKLRNKVVSDANKAAFRALNSRFMPFSNVTELYGLIQKYSLAGVVDHKFIEPFMEKIVE